MDIARLKEEASRQLAKGKIERAVALYAKLIEADPSDPQLRLRHAEASERLELHAVAISSYRAAAELFVQAGHRARGAAALKRALEIAPRNEGLEQALAAVESAGPAERPRAISLDVPPAAAEPAAHVQRLSEHSVAVRAPHGKWVVVSASSPVKVTEVDELRRDVNVEEVEAGRGQDDLLSEEEFIRLYGTRR